MKFPITIGILWACVWPILVAVLIGLLGLMVAIGIAELLLT
jgi:hypothetical protein